MVPPWYQKWPSEVCVRHWIECSSYNPDWASARRTFAGVANSRSWFLDELRTCLAFELGLRDMILRTRKREKYNSQKLKAVARVGIADIRQIFPGEKDRKNMLTHSAKEKHLVTPDPHDVKSTQGMVTLFEGISQQTCMS